MNYLILKNIIENVVKNFLCPACHVHIAEQDLEVVWAAWNTVNVSVKCPSCNKNAMIKTEVAQIDFQNIENGQLPQALKNAFQHQKILETKRKTLIQDEHIVELNKHLKDINEASDLFLEN